MKLKKDDYDFLAKHVPEIDDYVENKAVDERFVHFELSEENFYNIQSDMNDSIVAYGMDQQDTVNAIGKKLYQLYDLLPYLDDENLEYFSE
ncbi:hypothetical protein P9B03_03955 [Metasolibacillus meyeri]|uniref:Uncharacterized protein n=1 Tax=Metasolibacillus meyeri TaxID=1071052 RepID=A0AAW9NP64_9BACL|nr:hypothetical protein [Metasolibacillus meyeri]MEC1177628.1 hypothetical protein [Metasolibacillus meyeri]